MLILDEKKIDLELKKDGYSVVNLLDSCEVIDIKNFYDSLSHEFTSGFLATSISNNVSYRQSIDIGIKNILSEKISHRLKSYRLTHWAFLVKQAQRLDSKIELHYDWSFVDTDKFRSYIIWCPLIDVDKSNGCLKVVKGSHIFNDKPTAGYYGDFPFKNLLPIIEQKYLTELPIKAGQAVIFDTNILHCSPPNQTTNERVVLGGLMIPNNSTLRYYHYDPEQDSSMLEVFEVDNDFYVSNIWGVRPEGITSLEFIKREFPQVTIEDFVNKIGKDDHQDWKFLKWAKNFIAKLSS